MRAGFVCCLMLAGRFAAAQPAPGPIKVSVNEVIVPVTPGLFAVSGLGMLGSLLYVSYAVSKGLFGFVGDRVDPRRFLARRLGR